MRQWPSGDEAETWCRELLAAGWMPYRARTMWAAPDGSLHIGPFGAWSTMKIRAKAARETTMAGDTYAR